jgi:hypothetical protein
MLDKDIELSRKTSTGSENVKKNYCDFLTLIICMKGTNYNASRVKC